ncbi:hypothetical protein Tco_1237497 [Tanacetum coccineum]
MGIIRDRTKGTLRLSQEKYIGIVSKKQAPKTEASRRRMGLRFLMLQQLWLLRLLKATSKATLCFSRKEVVLEGFFDSDIEVCLDRESVYGYVFTVGGTAVSWMSRIQKCVAMSTTEAEYMAIAEAGKELVWLKNFLKELDRAQTECVLFCDNQSAIHLAKNPVFHGRTKHIKIRYHYIRELVSEGTLSLKKILRAKNSADMLTKVVTTKKLKALVDFYTGLRNATTQFIEAEEEVEVCIDCTKKEVVTTLPEEFQEGQPMEQPLSICNSRMVLQNGILVQRVLMHLLRDNYLLTCLFSRTSQRLRVFMKDSISRAFDDNHDLSTVGEPICEIGIINPLSVIVSVDGFV